MDGVLVADSGMHGNSPRMLSGCGGDKRGDSMSVDMKSCCLASSCFWRNPRMKGFLLGF